MSEFEQPNQQPQQPPFTPPYTQPGGQPNGYQAYPGYNNYYPQVSPYDHTAEYDAKDISQHKVFCMLCYLMSTVGIVIALLAGADSAYTKFHVRQSIKFTVVNILLSICILLLCWTVIVPIAGAILMVVLLVLKVICFFQICAGKAIEPPIIRSLGFLK